jgi:hypothetical protein
MAEKRKELHSAVNTITTKPDYPLLDPFLNAATTIQFQEAERAGLRNQEKVAAQVTEILRRWQREKRAIIGEQAWADRARLVKERRAERTRLAESSTEAKKLAAFHNETRRRSKQLLGNVDLTKLARMREAHQREIRALLQGDAPKLPPVTEIAEQDVPEWIRRPTHNPPVIRTPPYPWSYATFLHYYSSGTSEFTNNYLDAATGRVGHRSVYVNNDSDDNDYLDLSAKSLMGFSVPAPGSVKKWKFTIKALCAAARAYFGWEDEWGSSYTENYMYSNLRIAISTEPPTNLLYHPFERSQIWGQNWHGDDDWNFLYVWPGQGLVHWWSWTTPFELPNQSAFVTVGTADYADYYMDDVSLNDAMNNRFYIQQVTIETV